MKERLKNVAFRIWYTYISAVDKDADVTFMNYGYYKDNFEIELEEPDEKNRYSAQLYNFVATGIDVKGKDILEVGCGRGGGLSYISRYLKPRSATGVDLAKKAIDFCNKHYSDEGLKFIQGNAEDLPFENESFDVIINVESSHRYSQMDKFLSEVYRILKPGGFFLWTDFRHENDLEKLKMQLKDSKFVLIKDENITSNVLEALKLSTADRENIIQKIAPKFLHGLGRKFAATEGTPTFNKFANQEFEYLSNILMK